MKKSPLLLLIFLLIISGAVSSLPMDSRFIGLVHSYYLLFTYLVPGLAFGLAMSVYLYGIGKIPKTKIAHFVLASVGAWLVAYGILGSMTVGFLFINGLVGAAIIALATKKMIPGMGAIYPVIISGGIGGLIFRYLFVVGDVISHTQLYSSFIIWQLLVGVTLGVVISKSQKPLIIESSDTLTPPSVHKAGITADKIVLTILGAILAVGFVIFFYIIDTCAKTGGC